MKLPSFWVNVKWRSPAPFILSPRGWSPPPHILSQCGVKLPTFWVNVEWSSPQSKSTRMKLPSFWEKWITPHSESTWNEAPHSESTRNEAPSPIFWVNAEWSSPHSELTWNEALLSLSQRGWVRMKFCWAEAWVYMECVPLMLTESIINNQ